ncbi:hypothetical protein QTP70_033530 [Hemibagrus guttatus]|uniref:C-C motif chemokine n=1 Tax=Hemibagrus guttatus TaxID=175788 RepID=A0AAE0R9A2_9TELE|nr:hypothetical protein QTP70_033530 [Hemibagrus guttatus]KAK3568087.1 hypothetical protein QTP86_030301 [Hemibagrus guttatus]
MSSRSLLLVLLVLACLQSFTVAQYSNQPSRCCFSFQKTPIPEKFVISYTKTRVGCTEPGVIFHLTKDRLVCVKPTDVWVQDIMKKTDQHQEV